jgi:predicted DNA-binding transcriptional regulator YafY
MRREHKLRLFYTDARGAGTIRTVWPVAVGFFQTAEVLAAWCELRNGFRHFRLERIDKVDVTDERFPIRRPLLLAEWRMADKDIERV